MIHLFSQTTLTTKTLTGLHRQLLSRADSENKLVLAEEALISKPEAFMNQFVGFVPDHLEYGCHEGVSLFKISIPPFETVVAVRDSNILLKPKPSFFFKLTSTALIAYDVQTKMEQGQFLLPFEIDRGSFVVSSTRLALIVKELHTSHTRVFIFEITDSGSKDLFVLQKTLHLENFSISQAAPLMIRLENNSFRLVLGGTHQGKGSIVLIPLEKSIIPSHYDVEGSDVTTMVAMDEKTRGFADRLYLANNLGLFSFDFATQKINALITLQECRHLRIVPHPKGIGVLLYFLGQKAGVRGLFSVLDLDPKQPLSKVMFLKPLIEGDYEGFLIRYGYLGLFSKKVDDPLQLLDLSTQTVLPMPTELLKPKRLGRQSWRIIKHY